MRKAPAAPAAMRGLLRCFHRSPGVCVDKHLCAPGTTLWTHLRNLLCKDKVGRRGRGVSPGGTVSGRGLRPLLSLSLCWSAALAKSQFFDFFF